MGKIEVYDVEKGLVCKGNSWKVTATPVTHIYQPGEKALAYRIDSDEGSVVISGDVTAVPLNPNSRSRSYSSNIDLKKLGGELIPIGYSQYANRDKTLCGFAYEYDKVYKGELKCTSFVSKNFPEVDKFKWVNFIQAFQLLHATQQDLLQDYLTQNRNMIKACHILMKRECQL